MDKVTFKEWVKDKVIMIPTNTLPVDKEDFFAICLYTRIEMEMNPRVWIYDKKIYAIIFNDSNNKYLMYDMEIHSLINQAYEASNNRSLPSIDSIIANSKEELQ